MTLTNCNQYKQWQIKLLYDGDCPLCVREVNFLRRQDADRGIVAFVNIADDNYSAAENANIDYETAMNRIHAILPDGAIVTDLEVFRRVYEILGMGWVYSFTKIPIVGTVADKIYSLWAYWRLKLTGRPDLITLVHQRNQRLDCSRKMTIL